MVKNTIGGNKSKGQARKHVSSGGKANVDLRISEDVCEVYAIVEKMLGNGMCHVLCDDGVTRLCHIRGKFRGRGKRDNTIENKTWILVGLREWEQDKSDKNSKKIENCDLLEVYNNTDKDKLTDKVKDVNWRLFTKSDNDINNIVEDDEFIGFKFSENKNEEIEKLIETELATKGQVNNIVMVNNDWIDADEI
jgi:translation initiation factor 1A